MTVEEAGNKVGISGVQWHRYEAGSRRISVDRLASISALTGIPPRALRPDLPDIFGPAPTKEAV